MTSTYSRSWVAFGVNAPLFASHGDGGTIVCCDGFEYVDFVAGIGSVILGHRNEQVNNAIRRQLDRGINLSMGTELEIQVCERLANIPFGSNLVQLAKNGSDATLAAVRIARAYTGREHIIMLEGGYHGIADCFLANTSRGYGIPNGFCELIYSLDAILNEEVPFKEAAAIIVEPDRCSRGQLVDLQALCAIHNMLLIFDETFVGLRWPDMLASRNLHLHPDITIMGKSLANGMPLSACIGRRPIMERFRPGDEPNAFFSLTHGGECLSLAACLATLDALEHGGNHAIQETAIWVEQTFNAAIDRHHLTGKIKTSGAPLNRLTFAGKQMANCFRAEMARHGVLVYGSFNAMVAHSDADLTRTEDAMHATLRKIADNTAVGYEMIESEVMRR